MAVEQDSQNRALKRTPPQRWPSRLATNPFLAHVENQLCVFQRSVKRAKAKPADRLPWSILGKAWSDWKDALIFVKLDISIAF